MSTCFRQHFSCSIICILNYLIQIDGEEASRSSKKHLEREKARRDAAADFSEDLPDGAKGENINESSIHAESTRGRMPRIGSTDAIEVWANQHKDKKLYIVLIRYSSNFVLGIILFSPYLYMFALKSLVIAASNRHLLVKYDCSMHYDCFKRSYLIAPNIVDLQSIKERSVKE